MADGTWRWATDPRFPVWCVTFTRDLTPDEVLRRYGADPRTARMLARGEAGGLYDLALHGGTVLRAGTADGWAFCYEDVGGAGSRSGLLGTLSRGTETLSLLHGGDGTNHLAYWRDGERIDFELGPTGGTSRHAGLVPALRAVTRHTGVSLGADDLEGPLLTAYLAEAAPLRSPVTGGAGTATVGRPLGAVRPASDPKHR
ncbi:hypothetical protein GTW40_26845 [Streptomyces sp. SID4985]|uniref:DUF6461 domain-containing protein n=1 Tax=Streptomyces sp. SID4985 TaxID=2690292 RepID=UPI00136CABA6|nr:DUF6461 domain-containing protein [Streptomyces sp. SID4985]MYQ48615.1 hypothetical protein [Streptomyces sp. SID4985]